MEQLLSRNEECIEHSCAPLALRDRTICSGKLAAPYAPGELLYVLSEKAAVVHALLHLVLPHFAISHFAQSHFAQTYFAQSHLLTLTPNPNPLGELGLGEMGLGEMGGHR